jgi:hypothetical protein
MRRRVALLTAAIAAVVLWPAAPAGAGTTVSGPNRNNVVTITVPVDCVGCKDWVDPINGGSLAKHWEQTAEKAWNDAFAKYSYCNKYKFKLDIKIKNRPAGSASRFGTHELIATQPDGRGFTGAGWGGAPEELTPGGPEGQRSSDGTRYYEFDAQGTMPADATPTVIVHEFGHVLGLGDDRDGAGNPVGPDPKGIMVGGANGVTPNTKLNITKNHVDRIGKQLEGLGKITCGQAWNGDVRGTIQTPGCAPVSQRGDIRIAVKEDGSLTGGGTTISGAYSCDNGASIPEMSNSYGITGTKTRDAFTLTFQDGVQLRLPIHGRAGVRHPGHRGRDGDRHPAMQGRRLRRGGRLSVEPGSETARPEEVE